MGGVPLRVRESFSLSDFVTPFRLLSQASCRKETPRASPALREGPDPSFLGREAYWAKAGTSPHPGPPSSIRSRDLTLRGSQEGTRRHLSKEIQLRWNSRHLGVLTVGPTVCQAWCWALRILSSDFRLQFLGSLPYLQVKILGPRC